MTISIDGFMVCAYISEEIVMHTKYIFLLKQEYIYQCQLEATERVLGI